MLKHYIKIIPKKKLYFYIIAKSLLKNSNSQHNYQNVIWKNARHRQKNEIK